MGLAGTTKKLEIPGDVGQFLTIRQLNWVQLAEAKEARVEQMTRAMVRLASVKDLLPAPAAVAPSAEMIEASQDPEAMHDKLTLLSYGVTAWTYEGPVDVERFDERTAEWAAREILAISIPSEVELGKGSSSSTGT
jgi:hypothetical protein